MLFKQRPGDSYLRIRTDDVAKRKKMNRNALVADLMQPTTASPMSEALQFNEYVDSRLTLDYGLPTEQRLDFFGVLEYQALVDQAWLDQTNHAEAALGIAAKYYAKLLALRKVVAARALAQRISFVGQVAFGEGSISMNAVASALAIVEWANADCQT